MQNLFIKDNDEFKVVFWVATDKEDGTIYCDVTEENLKDIVREDREYETKCYTAVFKRPSFGDTIGLYDKIFSVDSIDATVQFNPLLSRYKKIALLIKSWDLKDGEGNDIEPKEENISKLHPIISSAIGIGVDIETAGLLNQM
tara:strand:+ start:5349 stop:5777 length:429 start_codon:yes stop_codon:yes gene_type:complete